MNRRGFLFGLGASIAVVTTPGVLMPVVPRLVTSLHDLSISAWRFDPASGPDQTAIWYMAKAPTYEKGRLIRVDWTPQTIKLPPGKSWTFLND